MEYLFNIFQQKGYETTTLQLPCHLTGYTINIVTGDVKTLDGTDKKTTRLKRGYTRNVFCTGKAKEYHYTHRLIAYAILGKILPQDVVVMHLDEVKNHNTFSNLAIGTSKENANCPLTKANMKNRNRTTKPEKTETKRPYTWRAKVSKSRNPHPIYIINKKLEIVAKYDTPEEVAQALGCAKSTVLNALSAQNRKCKGYYLRRANKLKKQVKNLEILNNIFDL